MGDAVVLQAGMACARLLPVAGGRIASLRLLPPGGDTAVDVLHPYPQDVFEPPRWSKGGLYPLMPYSNRIAYGRLQVGTRAVTLPPHPDAAPHTLHGNAHMLAWRVVAQEADHAMLELVAQASAVWPWRYTAGMDLRLSPSSLTVALRICNTDDSVMPAGLGLHPYFRHRPDAQVGYQAGLVWPPTAEFLARASRKPEPHEIHMPARVLPQGGVTDYVGQWNGQASLELPEGVLLTIRADPVFGHLVVHRPDSHAYVCLEPTSHVADGFNLAAGGEPDTGTHWLAPGESLSGSVRFSLQQPA